MFDNIKVVRFKEEFDVISEVVFVSNYRTVRLTRPLLTRLIAPEQGSTLPRLNLVPYLPPYVSVDTIEVDASDIRFITNPVDDLKQKYLEMMGFVLPQQPIPAEPATDSSEAGAVPENKE